MSDNDIEWVYPHMNELPCSNRAVVVLVAHKDGTFSPDIGRLYSDGWHPQTFSESPVVAWANIPSFKDHVKVVEADEH